MPAIIKGPALFADEDLLRLSGTKLLVSPTSTSGGAYDAQTGFKTPRGGVVCPDASWVSAERVRAHAADDGFWQMMPGVAIEVASQADEWPTVTRKIDNYVEDGARYALAVDPQTGETYERGIPPVGLNIDTRAIGDA